MTPSLNRIDRIRPDAPSLAVRGLFPVGVRTVQMNATPTRCLDVEVWYPAAQATPPGTSYRTLLRDGITETVLNGAACRDGGCAEGIAAPLIVLSHGYPGNRYLMAHFAECLASKGFVVAAPDHPGSTYDDQQHFGVTLLHRPLDQRAVIDGMAALPGDLGALTDTTQTGVIGFSMGGYGALILGGAGLATTALTHEGAPKDGSLAQHLSGSDSHRDLLDPRVKAILPIGPWGNAQGMWDAAGLAGLQVPMLLMAGSEDDVSGYSAMRNIFENTTRTERHLLSFHSAGHNAAAPIPAPEESWAHSEVLGWAPFRHYADPVWDMLRMNNIAQHFAAAFFGLHLQNDPAMRDYLIPERWKGFEGGQPAGLMLEQREAGA